MRCIALALSPIRIGASRARRVPGAALRHIEDMELILHVGDLSTLGAHDQLAAYAPVEAGGAFPREPATH